MKVILQALRDIGRNLQVLSLLFNSEDPLEIDFSPLRSLTSQP